MNKIELPPDPKLAKQVIDSESRHRLLEIEMGLLGKFFGSNHRAPIYIAGLIAFLATAVGFVYTFIPDNWKTMATGEFWKIISPLIMSSMAYIFGAASTKKEETE